MLNLENEEKHEEDKKEKDSNTENKSAVHENIIISTKNKLKENADSKETLIIHQFLLVI